MNMRLQISCVLLAIVMVLPVSVSADTYVIPFSDIRQAVDSSGDSPELAIRTYLASLIRDELNALGFDANGGLVLGEIPLEELTQIIETDCNFYRPYEIHTEATTATISIDAGSSLTVNLDSVQSITLLADLIGTVSTQANAWVRWGQNIPFIGDCVQTNTDHGWLGLTLPFDISLDLALDLDPSYDSDLLAIVVDKHATLSGQAQMNGGNLKHDFGSASRTDLVISVFEHELLQMVQTRGKQAVENAIAGLNNRLDGLDENGVPDPTITAFNSPTTFVVEVSESDAAALRDFLQQSGIPDLLISMLEDRGVEILLQLAILEGAEREAYLAALSASVSCDALLAAYEVPLGSLPIYSLNGQMCELADLSGPDADAYFTDRPCTNEVAFKITDVGDFCRARFGDQAKPLLGNAAAWVAGTRALAGDVVLVTAGGTREPVDAVRYLGNRSSGKMGFAVAAEAARRGASVVLVSGPVNLRTPAGVRRVDVETALEMREAVLAELPDATIVVKAAAVADFRVARPEAGKIRKEELPPDSCPTLDLVRNPDILAEICRTPGNRVVVGFAAESGDPVASARRKLERKGCDLIVANDVSREGSGFDTDTNAVVFVWPGGDVEELPCLSKTEVAAQILDRIAKLRGGNG